MNPDTLTQDKIPVEFLSGSSRIRGVLHLPGVPAPPLVVGSHGLEGTMDSAKQTLLAGLLPRAGIAFFRFDHRGCGASGGDFLTDTSLENRAQDLVTAVEQVLALGRTSRNLALFGSSLGGTTCIAAWERLAGMGLTPLGAVLCSAPVVSRTIVNIPLEANGTRPALPMRFFEENLLFDVTRRAGAMRSVLIFHGDRDEIVPVENARLLFDRVGEPKRLIIHKDGDHRMTSARDQQEFEAETPAWFRRCFGPGQGFS
jgi:alpha-beta hydrolase superfamily lysophospholipase